MKNRILNLVFLALMGLPAAHAHEVGNGGDVVVCQGQAPVVLDYYTGTLPIPGNKQPELEDISGMTAEQVVQLFSQKLAGTHFGENFDRMAEEITDLNRWSVVIGLKDVKDDGMQFGLPEGCSLVQGAVRAQQLMYMEKSVADAISPAQMGMLMVHEVLYALAVEKEKTTSESTRQIVRVLLRKKINYPLLVEAINFSGWRMRPLEGYRDLYLESYPTSENRFETNMDGRTYTGGIRISIWEDGDHVRKGHWKYRFEGSVKCEFTTGRCVVEDGGGNNAEEWDLLPAGVTYDVFDNYALVNIPGQRPIKFVRRN